MTRIYIVEYKPASDAMMQRLVDSASRIGALNFAARDTFEARLATQHEIVHLLGRGVKVEKAGDPQADMLENANG